jgi:hypothetical protein
MAQDRNSDEELVRSLDDQERVAALKRDVSGLERLWSEEFTVNAPNNQVVVGSRAVLDMRQGEARIRGDGAVKRCAGTGRSAEVDAFDVGIAREGDSGR